MTKDTNHALFIWIGIFYRKENHLPIMYRTSFRIRFLIFSLIIFFHIKNHF